MHVLCILSPEPGQPLHSRATLPSQQRGFTMPGLTGRRKSGATSAFQWVLGEGVAWAAAKVLVCSLRGRWGLSGAMDLQRYG